MQKNIFFKLSIFISAFPSRAVKHSLSIVLKSFPKRDSKAFDINTKTFWDNISSIF